MIDRRERFHFEAVPDAIPVARAAVGDAAEAFGMAGSALQDLLVAVSEAVTNAVRHSGASHVDVHVEADPEAVEVVVADDGDGILGVDASMPSPDATGGRGLPLMAILVDECVVSRLPHGGTQVRLRMARSTEA